MMSSSGILQNSVKINDACHVADGGFQLDGRLVDWRRALCADHLVGDSIFYGNGHV